MKRLMLPVLMVISTLSGCATQYGLRPERDDSLVVDGHSAQKVEETNCSVTAWSLKNDWKDLIVEFQVKNKTKANLEIQPEHFILSGPALRGDVVKAVDPALYGLRLKEEAKNLEERSKQNLFQGVDTLSSTLDQSDAEVRRLQKDQESHEKEKQADLKRAAWLREKEAQLRPFLSKGAVAAAKSEARGKILFPGPFESKGKATLTFSHPKCEVRLPFYLTR